VTSNFEMMKSSARIRALDYLRIFLSEWQKAWQADVDWIKCAPRTELILLGVLSDMVDFGSGQDRSNFATAGVASLCRGW
jgi:hypothetical protein